MVGLLSMAPCVDEFAGGVDDEHVRRGLGLSRGGRWCRWDRGGGGGCGVHGLDVGILLRRGDVSLLAGSGGDDGEPDDSFGGPLFLQVSMLPLQVVLLVVGAALVGPLEDDVFAAVLREGVLGAVGVGAFEVGGGGAGGYGQGGDGARG